MAPLSTVSEKNETVVPVTVNISLVLLKVFNIEVNHAIDFKFEISMEWFEKRVKYHNLKEEITLNRLTSSEMAELWIPYVIYHNTDMMDAVKMDDEIDTTMTVTREGNFTRSPLSVADEVLIFEGSENRITLNQTYSKMVQCTYNLRKYPFDTQVSTAYRNMHII